MTRLVTRGEILRLRNVHFSDGALLRFRAPKQLLRESPIAPLDEKGSIENPFEVVAGEGGIGGSADIPPPRRPSSLGNSLVLDWKVVLDYEDFINIGTSPESPTQPLYHALIVDAFTNANVNPRRSALWRCDDDNAYANVTYYDVDPPTIESKKWMIPGFRPLFLCPYLRPGEDDLATGLASFKLVHVISHVQDDWARDGSGVNDWKAFFGVDFTEMAELIGEAAETGFRPICIRACGVPILKLLPFGLGVTAYIEVKYSAIFVKDSIPSDEWKVLLWHDATEFHDDFMDLWDAGYRPICLDGFQAGDATRFSAILLQDKSSSSFGVGTGWSYKALMSKEEFIQENEQQKKKGRLLTAFSSWPTVPGPALPEDYEISYRAAWRGYPQRRMFVSPDLFAASGPVSAALGDIVPTVMQDRAISAGSLSVAKNGSLIFSAAYTNGPEGTRLIDRAARFRIASVSKSITSLCYFKLINDAVVRRRKDGTEEVLSLSTPAYLMRGMPDMAPELAPNALTATCGMLLMQQSPWLGAEDFELFGLGSVDISVLDFTIASALGRSVPIDNRHVYEYLSDAAYWTEPDDPRESIGFLSSSFLPFAWNYCNMNFNSLEWIIEEATQDYEHFFRIAIANRCGALRFEPAATERIYAERDEPVYSVELEYLNDAPLILHSEEDLRTEVGLNRRGTGLHSHAYGPTAPYGAVYCLERNLGSGGWIATTDDLVRLASGLAKWSPTDPTSPGMLAEDGDEILSRATVDAMWLSPPAGIQGTKESPFPNLADYVHGWALTGTTYMAVGSMPGASAVILRFANGITCAFAYNRDRGVEATVAALTAAAALL